MHRRIDGNDPRLARPLQAVWLVNTGVTIRPRRVPMSKITQLSGSLDKIVRFLAYHTPRPFRDFILPSYPYAINPAMLSYLTRSIDENRGKGAAVCEIGVGWGHTSVFLLEHMRSAGYEERVVFVDTFRGFTSESIAHEVAHRGKLKREIDRFGYASPRVFAKNLHRQGYDCFEVIASDSEKVDWARIGSLAVVLLDVDLYLPTLRTLEAIYPLLVPGGVIVVDDCQPDQVFDGALQAYSEFTEARNLPFEIVGGKAGLING